MAEDKFTDIEDPEDLGNSEAIAEANAPAAAVFKPAPSMIEVTITKFGDGKVSTGFHVAGEGDIYAARGDKITVSKDVAESLEVRGLAEAD